MYKSEYFCRWCGCVYIPRKWTDRDGFCSKSHKQALHRAYTKYVTGKKGSAEQKRSDRTGVTPKCRKK